MGAAPLPPLLSLADEAAYEGHFKATLSSQTIQTFDGITVKFPRGAFNHAFFESANRWAKDKSIFSVTRAERMDWIAWTLANPGCLLKQAWISNWKAYDPTRRLSIAPNGYCVWIQVPVGRPAYFVTAFTPDLLVLQRLRTQSPAW